MFTATLFTLLLFVSCAGSTRIVSNVVELNEKFLEVMNDGYWFVEFYAPWCAHCKKLAPIWERLGHGLADENSKVRVGKVDCTRFPSVTSALRINGYPTLIFFRNGVQIPYEGDRSKESMMRFAEKSSGPVVDTIDSVKFGELKKTSDKEPFFVFISKDNTQTEKEELYTSYKNISEELFTEVQFFKCASSSPIIPADKLKVELPTVAVFKDNSFYFYDSAGDKDLSQWINTERWPLMPQVTSAIIYKLADSSQKKLVLALVDSVDRLNKSTECGRFYSTFKGAALDSHNDADSRLNFQFGWLDESSMVRSILMGEMQMPNFFVFNLSSYEFYLNDDAFDQITSNSILVFLANVAAGNVEVRGGRAWTTRIRRMVYEISTNVYDMFYHQPILTSCLFGVPLAIFSIITYSVCSADFAVDREEIYPDEDDEYNDDEEPTSQLEMESELEKDTELKKDE